MDVLKILLVILAFFLQPVLWIGVIRAYLNGRTRMKRARSQFNTAVYEKHYEFRHFWVSLLVLGIIISLISVLVGATLPLDWVVIYEALAGLSLILIPSIVIPVLIMIVPSLMMVLMNYHSSTIASQNYVLIAGLIILALGMFIGFNGGRYNVPRIFRNERNNRIAGYPFKELSVFPMLVMIPGNIMRHVISFYPTFMVDGHRVAFLLVPIMIGLRLTVFKHQPRKVFRKLGNHLMVIGILGMLLAVASYKWPILVMISLPVLLLLSWFALYRAKRSDLKHGDWFSEVINGVRIVGIEPGTPAAKMNLHVGDVILNVNHKAVHDEDSFYEALQDQPTYCRLRVINTNHRIILTNTAIYSGTPHEIGVVLFRTSNL